MDYFHYKNRELYCEDVPAAELAAEYGTPCGCTRSAHCCIT
jgi:hypothetical protein